MEMLCSICIEMELALRKNLVYIFGLHEQVEIPIDGRKTYVGNILAYRVKHPIGSRMHLC